MQTHTDSSQFAANSNVRQFKTQFIRHVPNLSGNGHYLHNKFISMHAFQEYFYIVYTCIYTHTIGTGSPKFMKPFKNSLRKKKLFCKHCCEIENVVLSALKTRNREII